MKETTFSFSSKDGRTKIHGVKWLPDNGEYRAILQVVHGMTEYIERYRPLAEYLTGQGFAVVGHDHAGHGDSVVNFPDDLGFVGPHPSAVWVADIHRVRKNCQEEGKPYFLMGHSMGSFLVRKYLGTYSEGLSGAILMGTGYMGRKIHIPIALAHLEGTFRGWRHRSPFLQKLSGGGSYEAFGIDETDPAHSWLTRDTDIVRGYADDPKCGFLFTDNAYLGLFEAVRDANDPKVVARYAPGLPILLVSGEDDIVGDVGVGIYQVRTLLKKNGVKDVTVRLYPEDRHELVNELDREQVFADIYQWMGKRI